MTGLFSLGPKDPEKRKALLKKKDLRKFVKQKQYDRALKMGLEILEKLPNDEDVLFIVGSIYYMGNKHNQALEHFDRALEIGSYDTEVLLLKANSLFTLKKYDGVVQCCNKIKEIDPKNKAVAELLSKIPPKN